LPYLIGLAVPAFTVFAAFFLLPLARLFLASGEGPAGFGIYWTAMTTPRYWQTLVATVGLSLGVTGATLILSGISGVFLSRNDFPGKSLLVSLLTFPLAFPGVVVGFMIIMLVGRQGLIGWLTQLLFGEKLVMAYSMGGLFLGYLYFSIPRVILTVMAAAEKIDPRLEEAARSLGATAFQVIRDVLVPALTPALISAGALCFATSMGAFGTAFTLATEIDVLPILIYTEFTQLANISVSAALSIILGVMTLAALSLARTAAGNTVAAAA
jgi:putative spermidine/putrescine transport system permease protein